MRRDCVGGLTAFLQLRRQGSGGERERPMHCLYVGWGCLAQKALRVDTSSRHINIIAAVLHEYDLPGAGSHGNNQWRHPPTQTAELQPACLPNIIMMGYPKTLLECLISQRWLARGANDTTGRERQSRRSQLVPVVAELVNPVCLPLRVFVMVEHLKNSFGTHNNDLPVKLLCL